MKVDSSFTQNNIAQSAVCFMYVWKGKLSSVFNEYFSYSIIDLFIMDIWLIKNAERRFKAQGGSLPSSSKGNKSSKALPVPIKKMPSRKSTTTINNGHSIRCKRRKYQESFIQFGFTWSGSIEDQYPHCLVCATDFAQSSMKASHMRRHLESRHGELMNKPVSYFRNLLAKSNMSTRKSVPPIGNSDEDNALKATYEVSLMIAKSGQVESIDQLIPTIMLCTEKIVSTMFGQIRADKLKNIQLSSDIVLKRIAAMAENVKIQMVEAVQSSEWFALQIDESTDVVGLNQLLVFVRGIANEEMFEDILFCKPLQVSPVTGEDLFNMINTFFTQNSISWSKCISVATDGAKAMNLVYFDALLKMILQANANIRLVQCCIHRDALLAKSLPFNLSNVLSDAVNMINFIKTKPLECSSNMYEEMGCKHEQLFTHTERRWLSQSNVLARFFESHEEIEKYFAQNSSSLTSKGLPDNFEPSNIGNREWLIQLAYLSDLLEKLNFWNASLQGEGSNVFHIHQKSETMLKMLELWKQSIQKDNSDPFEALHSFLTKHETNIGAYPAIKDGILFSLGEMQKLFRTYFAEPDETLTWIRDPFTANVENTKLDLQQMEELMSIACDPLLKATYADHSLINFWIVAKGECPSLASIALQHLLPFTCTNLCESAFSFLVCLKMKYISKENFEEDLRLRLSNFSPDIDELCEHEREEEGHMDDGGGGSEDNVESENVIVTPLIETN